MNTPNTKTLLFQQQRGLCYYCAEPMLLGKVASGAKQPRRLATLDHIIPLSKNGAFGATVNCVVACAQCNGERGNQDARMFLLKKQGFI